MEAEILAKAGCVTSGIDISDGLGSELHHLARQSGVGFSIEEARLPITDETARAGRECGLGSLGWALYGGEDYELLLTLSPEGFSAACEAVETAGGKLYSIGEVVPAAFGVQLISAQGQSSAIRG